MRMTEPSSPVYAILPSCEMYGSLGSKKKLPRIQKDEGRWKEMPAGGMDVQLRERSTLKSEREGVGRDGGRMETRDGGVTDIFHTVVSQSKETTSRGAPCHSR